MRPCDLEKTRRLAFDPSLPGQASRAQALLAGLDGLAVEPGRDADSLTVRYHVAEYTLAGLEAALGRQGFRLRGGMIAWFARALVHFCEDVQRRNLAADAHEVRPQHVYLVAYERHLHGDRDDTPEEWRHYQ